MGAANAADLSTTKAPTKVACFDSFMSYISASATECPLSYMGVTVYGQLDMGVGYSSSATPLNRDYPNGVQELIAKTSRGGRWQFVPSGLSQSNVGVKFNETIVPGWALIGDANFGFDPYTLRFANGPRSLEDNNTTPQVNQTANGDSSRSTGWDNSRAFIGVSNATFGTLTFGRQNSFMNDASSKYDPYGGSYAFSLIGNSGSVLAGNGYTETARYNESVKYLLNYSNFHVGGLLQIGGFDQSNASQAAAQAEIGADFGGFSVDAIYAYDKDADKLSAFGGSTGVLPTNTLKATLANINAGVLAAKYTYNAVTVFGGYEYSNLSNPSDAYGATATTNGIVWNNLNGGYPAQIQKFGFPKNEILQVAWVGAKYAVRSDIDIAAGYYHEWQNNYTAPGTNCGPNTTAPAPGYAPKGAANSACSGTTDWVSAMVDYRPLKRVDLYAGIAYSTVGGGMASGFFHTYNIAPTAGFRVSF